MSSFSNCKLKMLNKRVCLNLSCSKSVLVLSLKWSLTIYAWFNEKLKNSYINQMITLFILDYLGLHNDFLLSKLIYHIFTFMSIWIRMAFFGFITCVVILSPHMWFMRMLSIIIAWAHGNFLFFKPQAQSWKRIHWMSKWRK